MSATSNKRSRKSKLVPRDCIDLEDGELSVPSISESPSKKSRLMKEVPAPIEFNVKIEVEEFFNNEEDSHYTTEEDNNSSESFTIKTEVIDDNNECNENTTAQHEKRASDTDDDWNASTSMETQNKTKQNKKSLLKNIYNLSQRSARSVKQCMIKDETVFNELNILLKTDLSPADRILAVESRNSWGRVASKTHCCSNPESLVQNVLNEWKGWFTAAKVRGTPLLYKCYICKVAWWHLHYFREHLVNTHDTPELWCFLEISYHECYLAANFGSSANMSDDFTVDLNCWQCGNDYNFHKRENRLTGAFYQCKYCELRFFTCPTYTEHQGSCVEYRKFLIKNKQDKNVLEFYRCFICKIVVTSKELLHQHNINIHTVRSDLPIPNAMKTCSFCCKYYADKIHHSCPRKNYSILCVHCDRRFPSKLMRDIHKNVNQKDFICRICNKVLPNQCMEMKHMVSHSKNFKILYKCITCEENIFLLDEPSLKQHTVIWHRKKFDKRRNFVEVVVVPAKCVTSGMVEQLDIVTSLSGKFEIVAKPNSNGILEVSQVEEIDFGNKKKRLGTANNEMSTEDVISEDKSDEEDLGYTIVEDDVDDESDDDSNNTVDKTNEDKKEFDEKHNEHNPTGVTYPTNKNGEKNITAKANCASKNKTSENIKVEDSENLNEDSLKMVKVKVEKDDEIQENIQEVDYIFNKVIKKEPNLENTAATTTENDAYATLLCKVFGGSHNVTTSDEIHLKTEIIEDEYFEDDIIVLAQSAESAIKQELKNDPSEEEIDVNSERKSSISLPSSSNKKAYRRKKKKCKQCDMEGTRFECTKHWANCGDLYKCTKCDNDYATIEDYAWHFTEHGYDENSCPACDMVLTKKCNFAVHIKMHVRYSFYKVQLLENGANDGGVDNVTEGNIDLLYTCKECKENVDVEQLFAHWESHFNLEKMSTFNLDFNEDKLNTSLDQSVLKAIKERLLSRKDVYFRGSRTCCICNRTFARKNDHKRHLIEHLLSDALLRHEDNSGLVCHFCGIKVEKSDKFRQHLRDHASLPVYRCVICSKSFSDSSNFAKHRKTHNFHFQKCEVCHKKFHSAVMLEKHMEVHEKTKPIKCTCCNKTFFEETSYRRHMRSIHRKHNHEFKCPICHLKYSTLKEKWDHMWTVHKIRKQQADCPICHKSFRKYQDVRTHMKVEHKRKVSFVNKKLMKIVKLVGEDAKPESSSQIDKIDEEMYVVYEDEESDVDDTA